MSRFTRNRTKSRKKNEESLAYIDSFFNNVNKSLEAIKNAIVTVGEYNFEKMSYDDKISLWKNEFNKL